jgi:hypothetical protein
VQTVGGVVAGVGLVLVLVALVRAPPSPIDDGAPAGAA